MNKLWKVATNSKGDTLMTVLAAVGVVAIGVSVIVLYPKLSVQSTRVLGGDQCLNRASEIVSTFTADSNKLVVTNWHPTATDPNVPPFLNGRNRLPANVPIIPPAGNVTASNTHSWVLVDASYNWLAQYYNTTIAACSTVDKGQLLNTTDNYFFNSPFRISSQSLLKNEQIHLNIQRADLVGHNIDCNRPVQMVASNSGNIGNTPPTALKVTATVSYQDNSGRSRECSSHVMLKPDSDNTPPVPAPVANLLANPTLNPAPGACGVGGAMGLSSCECAGGVCMVAPCVAGQFGCTAFGANQVRPFRLGIAPAPAICADKVTLKADLEIATLSTEPGTIYSCSLNSSPSNVGHPGPGANYVSCNNFASGGAMGNITARNPAGAGATTGIRFRINSLPIGNHTLSIQGVDSSRNVAIANTYVSVIDPCPTSETDRYCPPPKPLAPNACMEPNQCPGTKPMTWCPNPDNFKCNQPLFDECDRQCGVGRGPADPTQNSGFMGIGADACGHCTVQGTCVEDLLATPPKTCPTSTCTGPNYVAILNSCQRAGSSCPTLETMDNAVGTWGNSYGTNSTAGSYRFAGGGLANGCTMDFVGAEPPAPPPPACPNPPPAGGCPPPPPNPPYGPTPVTLTAGATQTFTFGNAGPNPGAAGTATRDLILSCGGQSISCRYEANCTGAGGCTQGLKTCLP